MFRSIAAVVGSYLISIVLVLATDPLLTRLFPQDYVAGRIPSDTSLLAGTGFFVLISIFCAWLCVFFSPRRAGRHVLWFFILGEVMGVVATIMNWNNGWPRWYFVSWLIVWPIACWIGLKLAGRRESAAAA